MWDLLSKRAEECGKLRDLLEESAAARPVAVTVEQLIQGLPAAERAHIAACENCLEAAEDILATRKIFKDVTSDAGTERPWFATRVMAAIAARERELTEAASTWLAVPKFASRLAMASGPCCSLRPPGCMNGRSATPNQQAVTLAAQESLFEAPPPMNQDDVLVPARRTIDERNVGDLEGRSLGGRGIPSGCGAGRSAGLLVRASPECGCQYAAARAGQTGTTGRALDPGVEFDQRTESTGGRDPFGARTPK